MNVKELNSIVKSEKIKATDTISVRISVQDADGNWRTEIVPIEGYYVTAKNGFMLGCSLWHPDAE